MLGNHFEALILLFEEDLRSERPLIRKAWRGDGVQLRGGRRGGHNGSDRSRCRHRATYKDCHLACDTMEKPLVVGLHTRLPDYEI